MTDAREKIADALWGSVDEGTFEYSVNSDQVIDEMADAILAALPDIMRGMVKPLVWSKWADRYCIQTWNGLAYLAEARTSIGVYRIGRKHRYVKSTNKEVRPFDSEYSSEWYVDAPFSAKLLGPFKSDVAAKSAAEAHHVSQAMAVFGEGE